MDCSPAPPMRLPEGAEGDALLARRCKALGHPHRVAILRFLLAQETCYAGAIADHLPLAASTVSQHLAHLRDAGLVIGEIEGPRRSYCVDPDALEAVTTLLGRLR